MEIRLQMQWKYGQISTQYMTTPPLDAIWEWRDVSVNAHVKLQHTVNRAGTITIEPFLLCWKNIVNKKALTRIWVAGIVRVLCHCLEIFIVEVFPSKKSSISLDVRERRWIFNLKKIKQNWLYNSRVRVHEMKLQVFLLSTWEICMTLFQAAIIP